MYWLGNTGHYKLYFLCLVITLYKWWEKCYILVTNSLY